MTETFLSGAQFDLPLYEGKPRTTYMICSTARCGSTLLCGLLQSTGCMGVPHEYFNLANHGQQLIGRLKTTPGLQVTMEEYLGYLVSHRTTDTGVFGLKAHINQCLPFFQNGLIAKYFGPVKYIAIRRRDLLGQAISLVIASQTSKWTSHETAAAAPAYSSEAIEKALTTSALHNSLWDQFFLVNGIEPCVVTYEDLLENPKGEVQKVIDYVGVDADPAVDLARAGLSQEANSLNRQWKDRFQETLRIQG